MVVHRFHLHGPVYPVDIPLLFLDLAIMTERFADKMMFKALHVTEMGTTAKVTQQRRYRSSIYWRKTILFPLLENKMTGIPTSSFHMLGQILFEEANKEYLYDSSESFMKPGSDRFNSSFYDYSSSDSSLDLSLSLIEDLSSDLEDWFFKIN